ncbi:hypothetical protein TRIATDRAFT_89373 [Trichoderma atroviride IMI 206040]|uniref:Uncharacterized protein n=1 Tax=Hypocrea atroviridis (strain ATCC 20476 / IMI 206040) TaxID=452589 RepID=G9P9A0_HYPAI|nr:uncharacterized protein TRIATDRAFT_89373 [Trichoderma atroviride IMI 206040]EHK40230.1 hypothetical protein TRIATDRAFT_89373 [Trichoderma atroviride IMI 206040]
MKSYFPEDIAIYPGRSAAHCELRRKFRKVAFDAIRKIAQEGKTVLMTTCLVDSEADIRTFEEHISIVRDTCIPIYWLNLGCDRDVLEKRVISKERREGGKSKLTDASVLRQIVEDHKLLNPRPYDYEPVRLIAESMDTKALWLPGAVDVSLLTRMANKKKNDSGVG